jgi:hypothetical protein
LSVEPRYFLIVQYIVKVSSSATHNSKKIPRFWNWQSLHSQS